MIAYKGFDKGYICRGYQYAREGWNETSQANCVKNGFHAATNPLDVLSYYPNAEKSVYCIVECSGDIDEDGRDEKLSCTRLRIVQDISLRSLIVRGLVYIYDHPKQPLSSVINSGKATAQNGYAIVKGENPQAKGTKIGDVLAFIKTDETTGIPLEIAWLVVDGEKIKPGVVYDFDSFYSTTKIWEER